MPALTTRVRVLVALALVLTLGSACSHKAPEVGVHAASPTQLEIDSDLTSEITTTMVPPTTTSTAPPVTTTAAPVVVRQHELQGSNSTPCSFSVTSSAVHAVAWEHPNEAMLFWLYESGAQDPITSGGTMTDGEGATDWAVSIPSTYEGKNLEVVAQFGKSPATVCNPYPYAFHFSKML
jgi:hypothetical protein